MTREDALVRLAEHVRELEQEANCCTYQSGREYYAQTLAALRLAIASLGAQP